MSQSLRPLNVPGDAPAGGQSGLPGISQPSAGDIADEINDHLACRRTELETEGVEQAEADERAHQSFGDARKIAREVFWIHHGEHIMSQRLLWAAIGLVLVALLANLYMQQRSTAAMNAAIAKLAEQMGRSQQPMGEARIKVVDENGKPRAGVKVTVSGMNPSPYLSNATYTREFESNQEGMIHTGPIILGTYMLQSVVFGAGGVDSTVGVRGPGLSLLNDGQIAEATLTSPRLKIAQVTIESPEVAGWKLPKSVSFESSQRFGSTTASVRVTVPFGEGTAIPLLPAADLDLHYKLERTGTDPRKGMETFDVTDKLLRTEHALADGGTIRLGLPRRGSLSLSADGEVVHRHSASQAVE